MTLIPPITIAPPITRPAVKNALKPPVLSPDDVMSCNVEFTAPKTPIASSTAYNAATATTKTTSKPSEKTSVNFITDHGSTRRMVSRARRGARATPPTGRIVAATGFGTTGGLDASRVVAVGSLTPGFVPPLIGLGPGGAYSVRGVSATGGLPDRVPSEYGGTGIPLGVTTGAGRGLDPATGATGG